MEIESIITSKRFFLVLAVLFTVLLINPQFIFAQNSEKKENDSNVEDCKKCREVCRENYVLNCPSAPRKVSEFSIINSEDEAAHLDNLFAELNSDPNAVGYIVAYGGRVNKFGEFKERTERLKTYIKIRRFDPSRIIIIHGGFREKFGFELWISAIKDSYPPLSPTIEPEKVKFRGLMKSLNIGF